MAERHRRIREFSNEEIFLSYYKKNAPVYEVLADLLVPWYEREKRLLPFRENTDPYRVWVSEIMLQQTRVEAAMGHYERFMQELPSVKDLAEVSDERLMKLWEGLGYYSRARNLKKTAQLICTRFGGEFPHDIETLKTLPGIGEYSAGAIASICFEQKTPAVDGNVLRVVTRLTNDETPIDSSLLKKQIYMSLKSVYPENHCGTFTQSLMELGAVVCTPKSPRCLICPLNEICLAKRAGAAAQLPVKKRREKKPDEAMTVFLLVCDGKVALQKRKEPGVLRGMWQFPNVAAHIAHDDVAQVLQKQYGVCVQALKEGPRFIHVFTHLRWDMHSYVVKVKEQNGVHFSWVDFVRLEQAYSLPSAFRRFLVYAQNSRDSF